MVSWTALVALMGCTPQPAETGSSSDPAGTDTAPEPMAMTRDLGVLVTLDGSPVEGAAVTQGGGIETWTTGSDGRVAVALDLMVDGQLTVIASHPNARALSADPSADSDEVQIDLASFDPNDNPAYVFGHPGTPDLNDSTAYCAHCHPSINEAWHASPHRTAASNPVVQDLYAGAAAAFSTEDACASAGGTWREGIGPGTGAPAFRCYLGDGVLPALNPGCDDEAPCDGAAESTGACADCHAPGIDGALGGRDLLEATGIAYEYGVHCDVCHHVESVDPSADAGVAGRLVLLRPNEPAAVTGVGDWQPLTFGPFGDVPNIRMGSVGRDHYHDGSLCSGCHQLDQEVLVPDAALDESRWPTGRLPVHSTYEEWLESPYGQTGVTCAACHMPPDPEAGNGADLGNITEVPPGIAGGWYRVPGSVRKHAWYGPRQPEAGMLQLAASLEVTTGSQDGEVTAEVTVRNVGCGHALPTGEPLRSLVLLVEATCDGETLPPTTGPAVPDFGGWLDRKEDDEDWSVWPGASVGDVVRVVDRTGAYWDYAGVGPFGDGTFDALAKGMPVEEARGFSVITAMNGDVATFDRPLPSGDVAYRGSGTELPQDGDPVTARAGSAGFAFGRVLVDANERKMVPHFLAVDVASDNRLLPGAEWTAEYRFDAACAGTTTVEAVLAYRSLPPALSRERGYDAVESVMARVSR